MLFPSWILVTMTHKGEADTGQRKTTFLSQPLVVDFFRLPWTRKTRGMHLIPFPFGLDAITGTCLGFRKLKVTGRFHAQKTSVTPSQWGWSAIEGKLVKTIKRYLLDIKESNGRHWLSFNHPKFPVIFWAVPAMSISNHCLTTMEGGNEGCGSFWPFFSLTVHHNFMQTKKVTSVNGKQTIYATKLSPLLSFPWNWPVKRWSKALNHSTPGTPRFDHKRNPETIFPLSLTYGEINSVNTMYTKDLKPYYVIVPAYNRHSDLKGKIFPALDFCLSRSVVWLSYSDG